MTSVRFTKLAEADVAKAASWYEFQKPGLGDAFIDQVNEAVEAIARNPLGYTMRLKDVRVANVSKFPFGLWFRYLTKQL